MKIFCPQCNASGNIPDHEIPEEGRFLSCPRCKHGFDVKKPKSASNEYLVDVCPACAYSTFGDERFGTCPKCGVVIKSFIDRQREEKARVREQELLTRKFTRDETPPPEVEPASPVADFVDNLHPVNLIGWGCALVAVVILCMGVFGLFDYYGTDIQARLTEQRDEKVSAWYVFLHFGLMPWLKVLYGGVLLVVALFFLRHQAQARQVLTWQLWATIAYVPVSMTIRFVRWWIEPIPHSWGGYSIEFFNILFMSALIGVPLYYLIHFLEDRRITSVVKLRRI
jgi:predicted Zn finger-like uncharacterized protein